jgi:hypothetical protein
MKTDSSLENLAACITCGGSPLPRASVTECRVIEGVEFRVSFSGKRCNRCGQAYFEGTDQYEFEAAIAERVAMSTASSPDAVNLMALATRIDEAELCGLLHVDSARLSDYRTGRRAIEADVRTLLALLVLDRQAGTAGGTISGTSLLKRLAHPVVLEGGMISLPVVSDPKDP